MATAQPGSTVRVHYTGTFPDGSEFDSSVGGDPIEFTIGAGQLIPGFEELVIGMNVGETRTATIPPGQGYGERDERLVLTVDRAALPEDVDPEIGSELELESESGDTLDVVIVDVTEDEVTLDGNHPLAGRELVFKVDLIEIAS